MADYPRMLYREGRGAQIQGFDCDTMIAEDESAERAAYLQGWRGTPAAAHGKGETAPPAADTGDEGESQEIQELRDQLEAANARADSYEQQLADAVVEAANAASAAEERLRAETEARIAAEQERDEAKTALAKFDRDNDGTAGGSLPRRGRPPKTE